MISHVLLIYMSNSRHFGAKKAPYHSPIVVYYSWKGFEVLFLWFVVVLMLSSFLPFAFFSVKKGWLWSTFLLSLFTDFEDTLFSGSLNDVIEGFLFISIQSLCCHYHLWTYIRQQSRLIFLSGIRRAFGYGFMFWRTEIGT